MWFAYTSWVLWMVVQHRLATATCPPGMFGSLCNEQCKCTAVDSQHYTGNCNVLTGECICADGYFRPTCDQRCASNRYGYNCKEVCFCDEHTICDHVEGCITPTKPDFESLTSNSVDRDSVIGISSAATYVPVTLPKADDSKLRSATSVLIAFGIMGCLVLLIICGICMARRCVKTGKRARRAEAAFVLPVFSSSDSNAALMNHAGREESEYSYIDLPEVGDWLPQNNRRRQTLTKYENFYQLPINSNHADKDGEKATQNRDQACIRVNDKQNDLAVTIEDEDSKNPANLSDGVYNILHQRGQENEANVKDQYSHLDSTFIVETRPKQDKSGDRKENYNHLISEKQISNAASRLLMADNYHHILGKQNFVITRDIDSYDHVNFASYDEKKS